MKILAFIAPFISTLILTPFIIKLCYKKDLLDYPKENSIHTKPIPILGGIIIFFVFFSFALILRATDNLIPFFLGSLPIIIGGIYDDLKGLNAPKKLSIQFISALILVSLGVLITKMRIPFGGVVDLGIFSVPITILWIIFIINLINIIDGLDGLATGLCAIVFFINFTFINIHPINLQLLIFLGSCLAFLTFNFNPAKIFLGNNGSSFLGFAVAYFSLVSSQKSTVMPILILPAILLLIHVLDIVYAIFRRAKNKTSIFKGDKRHIHYILLNVIKNHRMTVLLFYLLSVLLSVIVLNLLLDKK